MPKDRRVDRHDPQRRAHVWRPKPPDLWDRLEAVVGKGNCGAAISELVTAYLDGKPMPKLTADRDDARTPDARRRPRRSGGE